MSAELAVIYAALILQDDGVEITADKLSTLVKAAGVEVEGIWAALFAKALAGKDLKALLMNVGASGPGPAADTGAADGVAAGEAAPAPSEKARERRDSLNSDSDSDDVIAFGLFD